MLRGTKIVRHLGVKICGLGCGLCSWMIGIDKLSGTPYSHDIEFLRGFTSVKDCAYVGIPEALGIWASDCRKFSLG